jgi:hypothetical protein
MGVERSEKSKLEQSFESGLHAFGLALANLKHEEYLYLLITLEGAEGKKTVCH